MDILKSHNSGPEIACFQPKLFYWYIGSSQVNPYDQSKADIICFLATQLKLENNKNH